MGTSRSDLLQLQHITVIMFTWWVIANRDLQGNENVIILRMVHII